MHLWKNNRFMYQNYKWKQSRNKKDPPPSNFFFLRKWYKRSKGFVSWWSGKMNFVKCRVSEKSEEKIFNVWYFFVAFLHYGLFLLIRVDKTPPYIFIFHVGNPLIQQYFFLDPPSENTPSLINDWSHRSCSFLNILLFKILPQNC